MEYIVVVDIDGCIYGMWSDDLIGLYEVEHGGVEVERASHVEWCAQCQRWEVYEVELLGDTPGHLDRMTPQGFATREEALQWERNAINRRLSEGKAC